MNLTFTHRQVWMMFDPASPDGMACHGHLHPWDASADPLTLSELVAFGISAEGVGRLFRQAELDYTAAHSGEPGTGVTVTVSVEFLHALANPVPSVVLSEFERAASDVQKVGHSISPTLVESDSPSVGTSSPISVTATLDLSGAAAAILRLLRGAAAL